MNSYEEELAGQFSQSLSHTLVMEILSSPHLNVRVMAVHICSFHVLPSDFIVRALFYHDDFANTMETGLRMVLCKGSRH